MLLLNNQKVGITFKMLKKISQKLFKNVLVINYELHVSSRKATVWDGTFSSRGSGLAPVFEIPMNNDIFIHRLFLFGSTQFSNINLLLFS